MVVVAEGVMVIVGVHCCGGVDSVGSGGVWAGGGDCVGGYKCAVVLVDGGGGTVMYCVRGRMRQGTSLGAFSWGIAVL